MQRADVKGHIGMQFPKARNRARCGAESERRYNAESKMAAPVRLDILDHLFKRSELFEGFTDLAKQRMGFVGRDKASARQSEQLEPDLILGMAQNLADRRLRDIQAARRGADRTDRKR